jgi:uncharacterized protein (DUF1697 family)
VATWICLLRAVNVAGHNKVPMPALRKALEADGFLDVRTYVQSGNILLRSSHSNGQQVADRMTWLVEKEFGVDTPVVVRTSPELARAVSCNPFPDAARERPNLLHVVFLAGTPDGQSVAALHDHELARGSCRVDGDLLYVDYRNGVANSRLTPPFFARLLGVDGTARNWRTVVALEEMAR